MTEHQLCKNCQFKIVLDPWPGDAMWWRCGHATMIQPGEVSLLTGEMGATKPEYCSVARRTAQLCGRDGRYWVEKGHQA